MRQIIKNNLKFGKEAIDPKIFKAYDIRGIYPEELNEEIAYKIGRALVTLVQPKQFVVGRDMRLSSPQIAKALIKGICDQGADAIDIGMVSTDQFYFVMGQFGYDAGAVITASHNPSKYNGMKIVRKGNNFIASGSGMEELAQLVLKGEFTDPQNKGQVVEKDYNKDFINKLLSFVDFSEIKPFKIVIDASSGMAGPTLSKICENVPCEVTPLFFEPDGSFPGHEPDPVNEENRQILKEKVLEEKADFGFIFDGDADRFFAVDSQGEFVFPDYIIAILAKDILSRNPGAKIISDVTRSWAIEDSVNENGGEMLIERTGHSFIKKRMKQDGAIFAGETSGHFYFEEFYGCDTGLLPALLLLSVLSKSEESFSDIISRFREKYCLTGIINFEISDKEKTIARVEGYYKNQGANISKLDGIFVEFSNWRFSLRPSNTEPLLRLMLETKSDQNLMMQKTEEIKKLIQE